MGDNISETAKQRADILGVFESARDPVLTTFVSIVGYDEYGLTKSDAQWVLDAIHLCQEGILSALITGDKNDVVQFQDGFNRCSTSLCCTRKGRFTPTI